MDPLDILRALWLFLPAYVANMAPVFVAKLVPGWTAPIDGGRVGKDGQRILGPGKTWRGLAGGALAGGLVALAVAALAPHWGIMRGLDYGLPEVGAPRVLLFGAFVGLMALVGDFVKSYFKRRRRIERGGSWFPFDQLDFVVFGLLGMAIGAGLLPSGWVSGHVLGNWVVLATLLVLTPLLHLLVNRVGYWLGLKEVPW
ncbi:MAG: CDP-2,3-bis-(O-geranylgeranyl)-sn-glycerol synthase [Thermoplasmata archaeon]|jgi:CDP-2,3-bis-(O-geranylgeranyl)-sn-glycerol synthase|nr:CDP-2,3-bis-(O-geranylgeranyl)-sn-glycerol synthase [Thermoplasmata archaeon]